MRYEIRDVHRCPEIDSRQILRHRSPVGRDIRLAIPACNLGNNLRERLIGNRGIAQAVLAQNLARHPLPDLRGVLRIVDHGKIIRQGAISDLLSGTAFELTIECSSPDGARDILAALNLPNASIETSDSQLKIGLPPDTKRDLIAEINRRLVEGSISVYRLEANQASLESWFLEVTSRLGESE